ncbi:unnamed protein product [Arctogadus glacialis]
MVTISEPDPGLSEEPEDTSLDRRERRKRRSAYERFLNTLISEEGKVYVKTPLEAGPFLDSAYDQHIRDR